MRTTILLGLVVASSISTTVQAQMQCSVGAAAGIAVFDSTVTVGNTRLVDQGGDALLLGVRTGCGYRWPVGMYLGAEAELFSARGRSRAVVNGVQYSYELHSMAGAFARVGYVTRDSNAMFFVRGGAQLMHTNQGTQAVPAVGAGAEIPISARLFMRIDMTYAWHSIETYQGTIGIGARW